MDRILSNHYRDITTYLEEQIKNYYVKRDFTVYCVWLWWQDKEQKYFVDIEIGGSPLKYKHIKGYYDYKTLDEHYNFILSEH